MKKINWTETLVVATIEGVLVLVGVLLGFYFENIRERNENLELLQRDLKLLSLELTPVVGDIGLTTSANFFSVAIAKIDSSLSKIDKMPTKELKDILSTDLRLSWAGNNMEPRPYALDMMINSGSISLIRSDILKTELIVSFPNIRANMLDVTIRDRNLDYDKQDFMDNKELTGYKREILKRVRDRYIATNEYIKHVIKIDSLIQLEIK